MAILGWVLLIAFTITSSILVINWVQQRTESLTKETINFVEGRAACQSVKIANMSTNCAMKQITLRNIGMLHITKIAAQIDDKTSETNSIDLKAQGADQVLQLSTPFKNATLIPIITEKKEMIGCKEKKLIVRC